MRLSLLVLVLTILPAVYAQSTATYRVTFDATWSEATHPDDFPPNPHFSGLVGATHDAASHLWMPGALASDGIESMAETGSKTLLLAEVDALIAANEAEFALSGGSLPVSPGSVAMEFTATDAFSRVSLVTMLAPSPDWFVGVDGLDLREGGGWTAEVVVPLYVYDSGTDSGLTYTAPDADTQPPEPIAPHTDPPFLVDGDVPPVGSFTFTLLGTTATEERPSPSGFVLDAPFPNPASGPASVMLRTDAPGAVTVEVFDALGRRVAVLHDGVLAAGTHRLSLDTRTLVGGVYVIRAQGEARVVAERLVVRR